MPIQLVDIPNAPQLGGPVLDRGGARLPSVPGSARLDGASLSRAAGNLAERPVNSSGINAGVLALQDLGQAVRQAAGVPMDFAEKLMQAQNVANIARADVIMRDASARHQERMITMPEDKWAETWEKETLPLVREEIGKLGLSQAAQAQLAPDVIRWEQGSTIQIRTQATKRKIENGISAVNNGIQRATLDGDYELAVSHARNAHKAGLFSDQMLDDALTGIHKQVVAQAKERQANQIVSGIESDPDAILPELQKAVKGEQSTIGEIDPIKAQRFLNMAERESKAKRVELRNELHNAVLTGEITEPSILRERAGGKLDESVLKSLEKVMGKEVAFNPESVTKLRTAIASYDASNDKDMSGYNKLMTEIETTVPQRLQGPLASEISQTWNATVRGGKAKTPQQTFAAGLFSEIDSMADNGLFGQFKTKGKDGTQVDDMKKLDAWNKAEDAKASITDFLKKNPNATREEAINYFKGLLDPEIQKNAVESVRQKLSGTGPAKWWSGESYTDSISSGSLTAEPRKPATIRNNNPGAMWFVGGWQKKYGAEFGENLNDGLGQGNQIAKFPTPMQGAAAQFHLLSNYGNQTVEGAIKKWSGGNNVDSYLSQLGKAGFSPSDSLPEILADKSRAIEFVRAMSAHETGNDFPISSAQWQEAYDTFKTIKKG